MKYLNYKFKYDKMKRLFTILLIVCFSNGLSAQTTLFTESFEGTTINMVSSSSGSGNWGINTNFHSAGAKSDSCVVTANDTTYLTSNAFSTVGKSFITLSFDQICKIEFADHGYVEVSNDNGATWQSLPASAYTGSGQYSATGNAFNSVSYVTSWYPANNNAIPTNAWWKSETFNLSSYIPNVPNAKIRFVLIDGNQTGSIGNYGWLIDNISVVGSFSELIPPVVQQIAPIIQDTAYTSGPFPVLAHITDNTGIDTAKVIYHVMPNDIWDTLGMSVIATDTFQANIPFYGYGRSISYYIKAIDASLAHNTDSTSTKQFICKYSTGGDVIIGTSTSVNHSLPMEPYYGYSYSQSIFKSSYFNGIAGTITKLYYQYNGGGPISGDAIIVYMGTTNNTSFATSTSWLPISNFTTVYNGTMSASAQGWVEITLQTPYNYSGSGNLVIAFEENTPGYHSSSDDFYCSQLDADNSSIFYYNDSNNPSPSSPPTGTLSTFIPNVKLSFVSSSSIPHDIGVSQISSPAVSIISGQVFQTKVKIKNYGIDTLSQASIKWELDGVSKTAYSYTGSLLPSATSADINLGSDTATTGAHHIKAWTENPNGISDYNILNDTTNMDFFACTGPMSGTYTIGGANADFMTISDAVMGLKYCGISSSVVFNINNGVYNEQIELPTISGSSALHTVTFQSSSGDSSQVIVQYDAAGSTDNYVCKVDTLSFIKFKGITWKALDNDFSRVFYLTPGTNHINFEHNVFLASQSTNYANIDDGTLVYCDSVGSDIKFLHNRFVGGAIGAVLQSSTAISGWKFKYNEFVNQYSRGAVVDNALDFELQGNYLRAQSTNSNGYIGFYLANQTGSSFIRENNIIVASANYSSAIFFDNCNYVWYSPSYIYNNFFQSAASSSLYLSSAVMFKNTSNVKFYFNNARAIGGSQNSSPITLENTTSITNNNIEIKDNILTNDAGGYVFYSNFDNSKYTKDYNFYYKSNGPNFAYYNGGNILSFSMFKSNTGGATHSDTINPYFYSNTDLHVGNNSIGGLGIPLSGIATDIDGDARDANNPDPGADEFDPSPYDVAAISILAPIGGCGMDSNEVVVLRIKNVGNDTINGNLIASYNWPNSSSTVNENITATILPGDTLDYTFTTTANFNVTPYGLDSTFVLHAWVTLIGDIVHLNDNAYKSINSNYQPPAPLTSNVNISYGASTTLTAISNDSLTWWANDTIVTPLAISNSYTTPPLSDTTTFWVSSKASSPLVKITETVQYKNGSGATSPYPSYLASYSDFDGVEISNVGMGTADISGYTIHVNYNSTNISYTFPSGTSIPSGDVAVCIYGSSVSIGSLTGGTNAYGISTYSGISSSSSVSYWLTNPQGDVVDAFASNGASFPTSSGVVPSDFTGSLLNGGGKAGAVRVVSDNNAASDWLLANAAQASFGMFNSALPLSTGSQGCSSVRVPLTVNVSNFPTLDGSLPFMIYPIADVVANTSGDIKVAITNYGTTNMTSATVNYRINGQSQSPISWTGSLPHGVVDTITLASNYTFAPGLYNISAWTKLPNGTVDPNTFNDTVSINFAACLSGVYSIGDTSGGANYDFPDFTSAIQTLQQVGNCGNVVFNVAPGVYTEQLLLDNISTSSNRTVTFKSANGDSTSVVLKYTALSSTTNYVVRFDNVDYVTFKGITINALGTSYSVAVDIMSSSAYNTITNCVIRGVNNTNSYYSKGVSVTNYASNNLIAYNDIKNFYHALYLRGQSTSVKGKNNRIIRNNIDSVGNYGIYSYYQDSIQLVANNLNATKNYGIYMYYNNDIRVLENMISINPSSSTYGIYYYNGTSSSSTNSLLANNMINIVGGTSSSNGIYITSSSKLDVYFNTVNISSSSTSSRAIYVSSYSSNHDINVVNNIFSDSVGYCAYYSSINAMGSCDYNNYYTTNPASSFVYWNGNKTGLSALQSASSKDMHSVVYLPLFYSYSDLHLFTTQLTGLGTYLPAVPYDINHETRSVSGPTIGADEVPIIPYDIGVVDVVNFPSTTNENQVIPIVAHIKNYGTDTVNSYSVQYRVNSLPLVNQAYTTTILPGQTISVSLASFSSPAGNSKFCIKTLLGGDSNTFNDSICYSFYGNPIWDAEVSAIVGLEEGCGLTMDTVSIWIHNLGANAINGSSQSGNTYVKYSNNGSTVVTETLSAVINPGDSILYSFTNLVSIASNAISDTSYHIIAWVEQPNDNVYINDSAYKDILALHSPLPPTINSPYSVPYASNVTLTASSNDTILWYDSPTSPISIAQGPTYSFPGLLYSDDTVYVEARAGVPNTSVLLGAGTSNSYQTLTNGWYNYSWSANIYKASEIQTQGLIDTIYVQLAQSVSGFVMNQQTIYFSHTTMSSFASAAYPSPSGKTLVYSGTITWTGNAGDWIAIPLSTPFNYNGQDNLMLYWENHDGSYTSGYPHFYCTSNNNQTIHNYQDASFPATTGSISSLRPNLKFYLGSLACASTRIPYIVQVANPAPIDAGVVSITAPNTGVNLGASETVTIQIKNYGSTTLTTIPVAYSISGGTAVNDTVHTNLSQGSTTTFSFATTANISQTGLSYTFKAWTALANDGGNLNDTTFKTIQNNLPSYCTSTATSTGYEELTNVTLGNLNNTSAASGAKYTDFTQTVAPANLAPGTNVSLSITSDYAPGYSSSYSCYVKMFIDYNRDGDFDDPLEEVFGSTTSSSNTVTGTVFVPGNASIGVTRMRVVFREGGSSSSTTACGTYSWGETEDYLVTIAPLIPQDAGIEKILTPNTIVSNTSQNLSVKVTNYGTQLINSLQLSYTINNATPTTITYNTPIAVGASAIVNIGNINLQAGSNSVCAYTTLANDNNTFNDQSCKNVFVLAPQNLSYIDNFESNNYWLPDTIANQWERGTPQMTVINTAHSGSNVWGIDLDGTYANNSDDYLYSPVFNTANVDSAYLSFWQFMNVQNSVDYGVLQVSTGNGSWANLGYMGDPKATNWYNSQTGGLHNWSMQNLGWLKSTYFIDFTDPYTGYYQTNTLQFRFHFVSNGSVNNYDGWAIDDFKFMLPAIQYDAGVVNITTTSSSPQIGSQQMVTIEVKNWGYDNLSNIPVSYTVGGNVVNATIQLSTPLLPGATTFYSFVNSFTTPGSDFSLCASTSYPGDTYSQNDQYCKNISVSPANIDVGIDMVEITPNWNDTTIISYNDTVKIKITNYGLNSVSSVPVRYFINSSLIATETWNGSLASGASTYYTFTTTNHSPIGNYFIIAEALLANDANVSNDTAMNSYVGIPVGILLAKGGEFKLYQNQPNPALGITNIHYYLPRRGKLVFKLYDNLGKLVINKEFESEAYNQNLKIDASDLDEGLYYYSLSFEEATLTKKMLIIR